MISTSILFPGQGSQVIGMGRDAAEDSREAMNLWKKAEKCSGMDLRSIYWESNDAELMANTRSLQPALTVTCLTLWQALAPRLDRLGVCPVAVAGHSLGEYSALAASGALHAEAVLELVCLRGALMAEADPDSKGAMAAVLKLEQAVVEAIVEEVKAEMPGETLLIANYNTPAQFVLSGTGESIAAASELVKARKGRAMVLPVSGAFHSPLMAGAAKKLAAALQRVTWSTPRLPVYMNTLGVAVTDRELLQGEAIKQMTSCVRWIETIGHMWQDGTKAFLECGPKGVLTRMAAPILAALPDGVRPAEDVSARCVGSLEELDGLH